MHGNPTATRLVFFPNHINQHVGRWHNMIHIFLYTDLLVQDILPLASNFSVEYLRWFVHQVPPGLEVHRHPELQFPSHIRVSECGGLGLEVTKLSKAELEAEGSQRLGEAITRVIKSWEAVS